MGVLNKPVLFFFLLLLIYAVAFIAVSIFIAISVATSMSLCNLVGYISRCNMAGNYSLHKQTTWGLPIALGSTPMLAGRLFHLTRIGI